MAWVEEVLAQRAQPAVDILRRRGLSVITAESCSGGLVAAALSAAPSASECLHGGFVTYTKTQKHVALGVDRRLLQQQGAVNAEVARQMAEGALQRSHAALAVSVTGVLGPNPDMDGNPPGLVYLGIAQLGKSTVTVCHELAAQDPDAMRTQVVLRALELLLSTIAGHSEAPHS
jgi:nicotinamide-nucleotide amidase